MIKTSVYLTIDDAECLRHLSVVTGKSQAELIREGIRHVLDREQANARQFRSMGIGHGGGDPYAPWQPDDLYRAVMGQG